MAPNPELSATLKQRFKDESFWLRLPFMLLYFLLWRLAEFVLLLLVLLQLVLRLFLGRPQEQLLKFSAQLTSFGYQTFRYLTFNSATKPFPFSDWPTTAQPDVDPYIPEDIETAPTAIHESTDKPSATEPK